MGSLMEQHLLACHLASRTGAASAPDEVSMPAPLHGKVCCWHWPGFHVLHTVSCVCRHTC